MLAVEFIKSDFLYGKLSDYQFYSQMVEYNYDLIFGGGQDTRKILYCLFSARLFCVDMNFDENFKLIIRQGIKNKKTGLEEIEFESKKFSRLYNVASDDKQILNNDNYPGRLCMSICHGKLYFGLLDKQDYEIHSIKKYELLDIVIEKELEF